MEYIGGIMVNRTMKKVISALITSICINIGFQHSTLASESLEKSKTIQAPLSWEKPYSSFIEMDKARAKSSELDKLVSEIQKMNVDVDDYELFHDRIVLILHEWAKISGVSGWDIDDISGRPIEGNDNISRFNTSDITSVVMAKIFLQKPTNNRKYNKIFFNEGIDFSSDNQIPLKDKNPLNENEVKKYKTISTYMNTIVLPSLSYLSVFQGYEEEGIPYEIRLNYYLGEDGIKRPWPATDDNSIMECYCLYSKINKPVQAALRYDVPSLTIPGIPPTQEVSNILHKISRYDVDTTPDSVFQEKMEELQTAIEKVRPLQNGEMETLRYNIFSKLPSNHTLSDFSMSMLDFNSAKQMSTQEKNTYKSVIPYIDMVLKYKRGDINTISFVETARYMYKNKDLSKLFIKFSNICQTNNICSVVSGETPNADTNIILTSFINTLLGNKVKITGNRLDLQASRGSLEWVNNIFLYIPRQTNIFGIDYNDKIYVIMSLDNFDYGKIEINGKLEMYNGNGRILFPNISAVANYSIVSSSSRE